MNKLLKNIKIKTLFWAITIAFGMSFSIPLQPVKASGPGSIINCRKPINLSNSEGYSSIDPFMIPDPAGFVHLFWAERVFGDPGAGGTDAIMYSKWDGKNWSTPNDIFLSPRDHLNRKITGVRGVLDDQGIIHLTWMGPDNTLFYSSGPAYQAGIASAWEKPVLLAEDQAGAQYSFDIAYEAPQTLYILYGTLRENEAASIAYIRSTDNGRVWSDSEDIYIFPGLDSGASNIRLLVDAPDKVYATFTEWDLSGNGQVIYFTRSLDNGDSWEYPVVLDKRLDNEYERDWTNLTTLRDNELVVIWEGGFRAYPQAQYSYDGGETWTKPIDTFPWLIADNGYANLLRDGDNRLHTFLVRRIREGAGDVCRFPGCAQAEVRGTTNTLWHSVWEGGTIWRSPEPVGEILYPTPDGDLASIGGNFSAVAINHGNQLVVAWFDYTYFELTAMNCEIDGTSYVDARATPTPIPTPVITPTPENTVAAHLALLPTPVSRDIISQQQTDPEPPATQNPGMAIWAGLFSALVIVTAIIVPKIWAAR